jgi:hypothetical protein
MQWILWDFLVKNRLDRLFQQSHQKPWDFFELSKTFYFHHHRIRLLLSQFIISPPEFFFFSLFTYSTISAKALRLFQTLQDKLSSSLYQEKKILLLYLSNMFFCKQNLTNSTSFLQTFDSLQLLYNSFSLRRKFCFFNFFFSFFYRKSIFFFTFICFCFPSMMVVIIFPFYW